MKKTLIIGFSCLAAGLILLCVAIGMGATSQSHWREKLQLSDFHEIYQQDFHTVIIEADRAEITLRPGSQTEVTMKDVPEDFSVTTEDDILSITQKCKRKRFWHFFSLPNFYDLKTEITITLPEESYNAISISNKLGTIHMEQLTANTLTLEANCGDITLKNLDMGYSAITCNLGDIDLQQCDFSSRLSADLDCGNLSMDAITITDGLLVENHLGDLDLSRITCGFAGISLDCGDLEIQDYTETDKNVDSTITLNLGECQLKNATLYNADITNDCGDITVENTALCQSTNVTNALGDITLELKGTKQDYAILSHQGSSAGMENAVYADVDCGDLSISYTED